MHPYGRPFRDQLNIVHNKIYKPPTLLFYLNDAGVPACFLLYSGKGVVLVYLMGHYDYDYDYTEQP